MNAPEAETTMTFWEHLEELRTRVVRSVLAVMAGFGVAWYFKAQLLEVLAQPYIDAWNKSGIGADGALAPLHNPGPTNLFAAYIKISLLGGCVLALPIVLYQLWGFIAPGLYKNEKRYVLPFVAVSCGLFAAGTMFGAKIAFPLAFEWFLDLGKMEAGSSLAVEQTMMIDQYLEFVIQALVAFGVVFEIPVVIFFMTIIGLVNHTQLIKFFRYYVVIAFVVSAIITPPDVLSQLLLAGPLIVLYGLSIGIAWLFSRSKAKA
jgi:sec-independent protein translocase protein TatC